MAGGAVRADEVRVGVGGGVAVREDGERVVVLARSTEDVSVALRFCNARGLRVEIAGAATKRAWGGLVEADVVLETGGLSGVREHSWQDLTATVGAGTAWADMEGVLRVHGQMVALDPVWPERATVGGVLATNDSGAWRLRYGSARDLVIGMTIVLADGTIAKSGGKVVKNVAGYDLHKLMIGAFGTLGVITEVTFRLHPVPRHIASFTIAAHSAVQLGPLIVAIQNSHLLVEGMQLRADATGFHLDIRLNGGPETCHRDTLKDLIEMAGHRIEPGSDEVWSARESLLNAHDRLILKATMLPEDVAAFAQEVCEKRGECVAQSLGILFAAFPADEISLKLAEEFRYHVGLQGGTTVFLARGTGSSSAEWSESLQQGEKSNAFSLMREIKRQFDPERILNRGLMGGV